MYSNAAYEFCWNVTNGFRVSMFEVVPRIRWPPEVGLALFELPPPPVHATPSTAIAEQSATSLTDMRMRVLPLRSA